MWDIFLIGQGHKVTRSQGHRLTGNMANVAGELVPDFLSFFFFLRKKKNRKWEHHFQQSVFFSSYSSILVLFASPTESQVSSNSIRSLRSWFIFAFFFFPSYFLSLFGGQSERKFLN